MPVTAIGARLRPICLALPEAQGSDEARALLPRSGQDLRARTSLERTRSAWCKVPEGTREIIIGSDPARFFIPPYFGAKGWIGVGLDEAADWAEVDAFVRRSYRLIAPKRLANLMT